MIVLIFLAVLVLLALVAILDFRLSKQQRRQKQIDDLLKKDIVELIELARANGTWSLEVQTFVQQNVPKYRKFDATSEFLDLSATTLMLLDGDQEDEQSV